MTLGLGLGLESLMPGLGLGLESQTPGLGLGLESLTHGLGRRTRQKVDSLHLWRADFLSTYSLSNLGMQSSFIQFQVPSYVRLTLFAETTL